METKESITAWGQEIIATLHKDISEYFTSKDSNVSDFKFSFLHDINKSVSKKINAKLNMYQTVSYERELCFSILFAARATIDTYRFNILLNGRVEHDQPILKMHAEIMEKYAAKCCPEFKQYVISLCQMLNTVSMEIANGSIQ